jgi:hypothetical protein
MTNNMLYYRAIKPIEKGEPLLAWYSSNMENELSKSLLGREQINPLTSQSDSSNICGKLNNII